MQHPNLEIGYELRSNIWLNLVVYTEHFHITFSATLKHRQYTHVQYTPSSSTYHAIHNSHKSRYFDKLI